MMSADASPPHASALLFDQQKTSAAVLLDQLNHGGFRASAPAPIADVPPPSVARKQTPEKDGSVARKQPSLPKAQGTKPARVKGYCWRANGSGWECRRTWTDADGKRKQSYVAHLSREAFNKLRRKHRAPDALATALADWIADRESEKGQG